MDHMNYIRLASTHDWPLH